MERNDVMEWNIEGQASRPGILEDERFDAWTDGIIKALVMFLTIVGIPFTLCVFLQFLFSL